MVKIINKKDARKADKAHAPGAKVTTSGRKLSSKAKRSVAFGEVLVSGPAPDPATVEHNILLSHQALKRSLGALAKPGVKLRRRAGVPLYWASPEDPSIFYRELDGHIDRGRFEEGEFRALA
jgi:hypothetical protein